MGWWKETIDIVKENDPAARSSLEVLLTYPGIKALAAHRLSHFLWNHGCKLLARMHSQFWRFWTQIEIHPGAQIASGVFVDHGSGLVIGGQIVTEALAYFANNFRKARLAYVKGNPQSQHFWEKQGFKPIGCEVKQALYTVVIVEQSLGD